MDGRSPGRSWHGYFRFYFVPVFLAVGIIAQGACLFALLLWFGAGDMFLKFALEDERFYELAAASHALSVFEDTEFSLPQPRN
jgi:fumarate reductase subunit C